MAGAILPRRRSGIWQSVESNLNVDRGNPVTNRLLALLLPSSGGIIDIAGNRFAAGTHIVTPDGLAVHDFAFDANETPDLDWSSGPFSVFVFGYAAGHTSTGQYARVLGRAQFTTFSNSQGWEIQQAASNDATNPEQFVWANYRNSTSNNLYNLATGGQYSGSTSAPTPPKLKDSGSPLTLPQTFSLAISSTGARRLMYYRLGRVAASTAGIFVTQGTSGDSGFAVPLSPGAVALSNSTVGSGQNSIYVAYVWRRSLSMTEFMQLSQDPYLGVAPEGPRSIFLGIDIPPVYKDAHTRMVIAQTIDVHTRMGVYISKDVPTRMNVSKARDVPTRMLVIANGFQDVATRMSVQSTKDVPTRMVVGIPSFKDVHSRMGVIPFASFNAPTRMNVVTTRDVPTTMYVIASATRDVSTRMNTHVTKDVKTRMRISQERYSDAATRMQVATGIQGYKNVATRMNVKLRTDWMGNQVVLADDLLPGDLILSVTADSAPYLMRPMPFEIFIGGERITIVSQIDATHFEITRGDDPQTYYSGVIATEIIHRIEAAFHDYTTVAQPGLTVSSTSPGGESEASWDIYVYDPENWLPKPDEYVTISDENGIYWSGLIERPEITRRDDNGCHIRLTARGYNELASSGDQYTNTIPPTEILGEPTIIPPETKATRPVIGYILNSGYGWWPAYTSVGTIISQAFRDLCPFITIDPFKIQGGGQSIFKEYNGFGKTAGSIASDLTAMGDAGGEPIDYGVWTDVDGSHKLEMYRRSQAKIVKIPLSSLRDVPLYWDTHDVKNKVVVKFSGGFAYASTPSTFLRVFPIDVSSQVDDYATAYQIAKMALATLGVLQAIGQSLTVEWPKIVYDANNNPMSIWRIKAGMAVQLCNEDLSPFTPWIPELPVGLLFIKSQTSDHRAMTNTLSVTQYMDWAKQATLYASMASKAVTSPTYNLAQPFILPDQTYPKQLPGGVTPKLSTLGSLGGTGWQDAEKDGDVSNPDWIIETDADVLTAGRKTDKPIQIGGYVLGFRVYGRSKTDGPVTCSINIGKASKGSYPSVGTAITTVNFSNESTKTVDLVPEQTSANRQVKMNPGDYLTFTLNTNVNAQKIIVSILFKRTIGSDRPTSSSAPTITSVQGSRNAANLATIRINANQAAYAQVEYGVTTEYTAVSRKTEISAEQNRVTVFGMPTPCHFRVHVWSADGVEAISNDSTI